jgi:hypothetical protein
MVMSFSNAELLKDSGDGPVSSHAAESVLAAANLASRQERPDGSSVTMALLDLERQTKQLRQALSAEALLGTWRLRFTAPKKPAYKSGKPTGNGFYIPSLVRATLSFAENAGPSPGLTIQNQLQLGSLKLQFTGPAKFLSPKNLLAFDFTRMQITLGKLTLLNLPIRSGREEAEFESKPVGQLPFFAFFAATESYIAARGRGGGLALWVKEA